MKCSFINLPCSEQLPALENKIEFCVDYPCGKPDKTFFWKKNDGKMLHRELRLSTTVVGYDNSL